MRKIIATLCCATAMFCSAYAAAFSPELDQAATQAAPWKVGEVMAVDSDPFYEDEEMRPYQIQRKFLGITTDGNYYVQDFYVQGDLKYTDPFVIVDKSEWGEESLNQFKVDINNDVPKYYDIAGTGTYTVWYREGCKRAEGHYIDGKLEGIWHRWYCSGEKLQEIHFKNDEKHGLDTGWFEDGQKAYEYAYRYGAPDGYHREWYESGQPQTEKFFVNGRPSGVHTIWFQDGDKAYGEMHFNELGGFDKFYRWDSNGNLVEEQDYSTQK